ncbi:MAG: rhodanese-like domain-containing protein [Microthrixaceae bacterium]|nr:rhodanese-like domain-containing protein [Microthrixaceae bacterium]
MPIEEINVDELDQRMSDGIVLVDVREADELQAVRVPGVQHIPLGELAARIAEIPEGHVHVICRSGARSMTACQQLVQAGRSATNVAGGTLAWVDSGRPTESG